MNNTVYKSKEKNHEFYAKNPSAIKLSPPSNDYYMEFYGHFFLFQYTLIGIVKHKFTKRNEIWCRIWEIEDLRKKQDRTSVYWKIIKAYEEKHNITGVE